MSAADEFHCHLDHCPQCLHHPMALCQVGAELLRKTAGGEGHSPSCSSNDPSCFYQAGCDCKRPAERCLSCDDTGLKWDADWDDPGQVYCGCARGRELGAEDVEATEADRS